MPKVDYVIHLTNMCNLHCEYCLMDDFGRDENYSAPMSWNTYKKTIDAIAISGKDDVGRTVQLTGGEALLRDPEFLEKCCKYAYEHLGGTNVELGLQSNFTRMTDELMEMFIHYEFAMSSSFDTFNESGDRRRLTNEQRDHILSQLQKLQARTGRAGFVMVLHEDNVDTFEDTWYELDRLGLAHGFSCLYAVENSTFEYKDMKLFCKKLVNNVFKFCLKHDKMERLFDETIGFMFKNCHATENQLCSCGDCVSVSMSIFPDGSIGTCFYDKSIDNWHYANIHDLKSGEPITKLREVETYAKLRKRLAEITRNNCTGCAIREACVSPCWESAGTLKTGIVNRSNCELRKYSVLYTYNFIMSLTDDSVLDYSDKLFISCNIMDYDIDHLKNQLEHDFKDNYIKLCEELNFDECIYK